MLVFTVCHINQLANAFVLGDSLKSQNPDYQFFIGLVDEKKNIPADIKSPYPIIDISEVKIDGFQAMAQKYTWDELSANCKPFFAQYFIKKSEKIIYFDCTTVISKSIDFLSEILDNQNIIIIPQLIFAGVHPDEKQTLNTGIYHSGMFGLKQSEEVLRFLDWWGNNTKNKGVRDLCKGLNADQLWLEHVPTLYESVHILKTDGINIGYWNLPERDIQKLKSENKLISFNYRDSKYDGEYASKIAKYATKSMTKAMPIYGIPNPIDKSFKQNIAKRIRSINNIIDTIIDKIKP